MLFATELRVQFSPTTKTHAHHALCGLMSVGVHPHNSSPRTPVRELTVVLTLSLPCDGGIRWEKLHLQPARFGARQAVVRKE